MRSVSKEQPARVTMLWEDGLGAFTVEVTLAGRQEVLVAAPPVGGARLRFTNWGGLRIKVCGIAQAPWR